MIASIKTAGLGRIEIESRESRWGGADEIKLHLGGMEVGLDLPDADDAEPEKAEAGVIREYGPDADQLRDLASLCNFAAVICDLINEANAEKIEAARIAEEKAEAEREQRRIETEQRIEDRTERLMMEFVGEEVKVRERSYKTMRRAIVEPREQMKWDGMERVGTGEYKFHLNYFGEDRTQLVSRIVRLDVKVGSRWKTLWDDGTDDLLYGDADLATSAKPTGETYDGAAARLG